MSRLFAELFFVAFSETLLMVSVAGLAGLLLGAPLGWAMYATSRHNETAKRPWRVILLAAYVAHALRATPSIIILATAIPLSHLLADAVTALSATLLPLVLIAAPFMARQTETALRQARARLPNEIPSTPRALISTAAPGIAVGLGLTLASLVGYAALAGALAGTGLGGFGFHHGYQEFRPLVLLTVAATLLVLAETGQVLGYALARRLGGTQARNRALPFGVTRGR
ncbi:DL-methionine transporter permease subunit [Pusillimonas sp. TS35]|uniref:DL-methionine transporter permease subunit n=1 Tax=Paracandidimonas lactea TaxID=2895524 RepID=UPI00136E613D|nr:DL-methionine transporter permease subunit [Paracandidimonas lactea]MYN14524.1 DL-methionine transporter permease subunit [Pusillimonas sp. TS35]